MPSSATPYGAMPQAGLSSNGSFTGKVRHIKLQVPMAPLFFMVTLSN